MSMVDREGFFRAVITDYGLNDAGSGAVAVSLKVSLTEMWGDGEWIPWEQYGQEANGSCWIVKKDGTLNDGQVQSLIKHGGWSGDLLDIVNRKWEPTKIQVQILREVYKDQPRYRISFINDWAREPGGCGNVDEGTARALAARFGSALRAIAGNAKRNTPQPAGLPSVPPPPPPQPVSTARKQEPTSAADIPF